MNIDIQSILTSKLFKKLLGQSKFLLGKKSRLFAVALQLLQKVNRSKSIASLGKEVVSNFKLLASLIFHFAKGNYVNISKKSILVVIGVTLYFITPIDLIPDFLPGIGYLDDITLVAWLFSTFSSELDKYSTWHTAYIKAEPIDFLEIKD